MAHAAHHSSCDGSLYRHPVDLLFQRPPFFARRLGGDFCESMDEAGRIHRAARFVLSRLGWNAQYLDGLHQAFSIRLTLMTLTLLWLLGCAGYGVQILWNSNLSGASHSRAGGVAPPCRTAVLSASARLASTAVRSSYLS